MKVSDVRQQKKKDSQNVKHFDYTFYFILAEVEYIHDKWMLIEGRETQEDRCMS